LKNNLSVYLIQKTESLPTHQLIYFPPLIFAASLNKPTGIANMSKKEKKTALLLCPHLINEEDQFMRLLHIEKDDRGIQFNNEELTQAHIQHYFKALPAAVQRALWRFTPRALEMTKAGIKDNFKLQKGGKNYDDYFQLSFNRLLHEQFQELKPFFPLLKLYQQVPASDKKGHVKTAPCSFSVFTPRLLPEVARQNEGNFYINLLIQLNEISFPISGFNQYKFLIESNNEYFLLSHKDFRTIEWLQSLNWHHEGADADSFTQNILSRLEADYAVQRNNLLNRTPVTVAPVCRILLSEINNAFLVLTPQFDYDGFIIEGPFKESQVLHRDGTEYDIIRDKEPENKFVQLIESLHPNFSRQLNGYYYLSFAEAQKKHWFIKVYQQLLEQDIELTGMSMLKHFRYSGEVAKTQLKIIKEENNQLTIELQVQFGKESIPLTELQKVLRTGQQAVLLKDGSIGLLDEAWLLQYGTLLKHGTVDKKTIRIAKWLAITEEKPVATTDHIQKTIHADWWLKWKQWQQPESNLFPLPATIKASLRPYQHKGFEWMQLLNEIGAGACLADDMGLGKTLQTICFLAHQLETYPSQKILIVCPASLIYNWQNEWQKFAPSVICCVYHGSTRNKDILTDNQHQVIITSYGTVRSDETLFTSTYFSSIVLDESHNIKNPAAQISKVVQQLRAASRITLSGTPIMNNTFDLYAQLQFALPGLFGSREFFKREYADPIDRDKNQQKIKDLQKLTAPFILRRTKEQVAKDLPPKTEITLWCEMEKQQHWVYEEIRSQVKGEVLGTIKKDGLQKSKLFVLQGIMKLRQVCNSPMLLKETEYHYNESVKTDELLEELSNNLSNHKALVFSQFTSMLDILSKKLSENHIPHLLLTGATPPKERDRLVQQFNNTEDPHRVFLLSLKAGNAGLNLTAADYVFLFDPWWNTAVEQQAIDRTHRIGQTKNVFAYKMICRGTIEEKIIQLQQRKKKLADELITEEEGFVKALSEEDVEFLFS
jgi:SNF2 family DNA or RNA helicase